MDVGHRRATQYWENSWGSGKRENFLVLIWCDRGFSRVTSFGADRDNEADCQQHVSRTFAYHYGGPYGFSRRASSHGGAERRGTGYAACETRAAWSPAIDRCSISRGRPQRIYRAGCDARLCELHYSPSLRGA